MEESATSLVEEIGTTLTHSSSLFGRKIDVVLSYTIEVLIDVCECLLNETANDIKFVEKGKKECKKSGCISFISCALTGSATDQLCTHVHCSPSFSFYSSSPPTVEMHEM